MIIVLEGQEGAGKTTFADYMQRETSHDIVRAFRKIPGYEVEHTDVGGKENNLKAMRQLGLIINTFNEDIVIAEVLSITMPHVTLDRSLPSSLVYGLEQGEVKAENMRTLFDIWQNMMVKATRTAPVYVHFDISYDVGKQRSNRVESIGKEKFERIGKGLTKMFSWATKFNRVRINANNGFIDPQVLKDRIKNSVGRVGISEL